MKRIIADIVVVLTVIFKIIIFGTTTMYLFEKTDMNIAFKLAILVTGAIWTAGIANVKVLIGIFSKGGDDD